MENTQKPISVMINEAEISIAEAINKTELSPVLLEPIMRNLYEQVSLARKQQIENDTEKYKKALDLESSEEKMQE